LYGIVWIAESNVGATGAIVEVRHCRASTREFDQLEIIMNQSLFDEMSKPVQELFLLGEDAARGRNWPDYLSFGITVEHILELLQIVRHIQSFWYDDQYDEEQGYTPIHAWRALGQLQAKEAVDTFIFLAHENEEFDSDWIGEEFPVVLGMIGPEGIPALKGYLTSPERRLWASVTVAHALEKIGNHHPESRDKCVGVLQSTLEDYLENDETLNAFLISFLVDLKAVEAVPLVERAFASGNVDISVLGDFEDFQIELGLLEERLTPPKKFQWMKDTESEWEAYRESQRLLDQLQNQVAEQGEKTGGQEKKKRRRRRKKKRK
jgi:hypothetical protein